MTVTEIKECSSSRVKVYMDDAFAFVLYKGELRRYGIVQGAEISEKTYEKLVGEVLLKRAKLRSMALLRSRDYTAARLLQKLIKDGYPEAVAAEALSYVESFHYVDDLRYAKAYIEAANGKKSRRRIDADLADRGVRADVIERAWENWLADGGEQDEEGQINRLLEKKHFDRANADLKERQRMYAYLLRRGFSGEQIYKALKIDLS